MLTNQELFEELYKICELKADDFYRQKKYRPNPSDIWRFIEEVKRDDIKHIHQLVSAIFSLKYDEFSLWMQVRDVRGKKQ